MIQYNLAEEKVFLLDYAKRLQKEAAIKVLESGNIKSPEDTTALAELYWAIVDKTVEEDQQGITRISSNYDVDYLLEKTYSSLHIAASNAGFVDVWDEAIPDG